MNVNWTNGSSRRVAKQIMDFKEEKIQKILNGFEPSFKQDVVKNIIRNRIERGRINA